MKNEESFEMRNEECGFVLFVFETICSNVGATIAVARNS